MKYLCKTCGYIEEIDNTHIKLISLGTAIIPGVIILFGYFLVPFKDYIYLTIASVLFILYDLLLYKKLMNQGVKNFKT